MSALLLPALAASSSGQGALYVDDVFSTYLYTGNGSTQTINNGIDLAGKGGAIWFKRRDSGENHEIYDTVRGPVNRVLPNLTLSQASDGKLSAFNSSGFSLTAGGNINQNSFTYASWTFRRAPKFFDVVTYTGDGVAGRQISHNLGVAPGMIVVKRLDIDDSWGVWHRSLALLTNELYLNGTGAVFDVSPSSLSLTSGVAPSSSLLTLGNNNRHNASGGSYVAYLFAHDPSAEGIIQCGSFTTDASGNATVNSGWVNGSQFAMIKAASTTGDWEMYDTARTSAWSGNDARLRANLSNAEDSVARISASGTSITFAGLSANSTYIYMVVRSPS